MVNKNTRSTDKFDKQLGKKIKQTRKTLGFSRREFGSKIGVTGQQLEKYEKGINRISASRLYLVAEHLDKPISYFFYNDSWIKA